MRKIILFSVGLLSAFHCLSQNDVNSKGSQIRKMEPFHSIVITHGIKLSITQGEPQSVTVSALEDMYRDKIKTVVENKVLRIYCTDDTWKNSGNMKYKLNVSVTVNHVDNIEASFGSEVQVDGLLKEKTVTIKTANGSNFKGEVAVDSLKANQSNGSVITVFGVAKQLSLEMTGGSTFLGFDLVSQNCNANVRAGSNASITVNKKLTGEASAGSKVQYKGLDVIENIKTSGESEVKRKN